MGTNYYLVQEEKPPCACCRRPYVSEELHIGKSSFGWRFSLHVIPENGINSLQDWKDRLERAGTFIKNEYEEIISKEEMMAIILERGNGKWCPEGRELSEHPIGPYCVGNFETYDLIPGVFS